jgi:hypothetical protein
MGGHPYFYSVDYEPDANAALQKLRQREFEAGRYNPVIMFPEFPVEENSPSPGPKHRSIEDALNASQEDGTRSILDLARVGDEPDYFVAARLKSRELISFFGTDKPTEKHVQDHFDELLETIERGQGVCFAIYENDLPTELIFAGYSFD